MSKHTPGPWSAVGHYCDSVTVVDSGGFQHVSATHCAVLLDYNAKLGICHWADSPDASREISEEEQAANAVLIAAAPELLAALKRMVVSYEHEASVNNPALLAARAAIAKATGEPS